MYTLIVSICNVVVSLRKDTRYALLPRLQHRDARGQLVVEVRAGQSFAHQPTDVRLHCVGQTEMNLRAGDCGDGNVDASQSPSERRAPAKRSEDAHVRRATAAAA